MGVGVGDYDNDGRLDIFVSNFEGEHNTLYRNEGNGFFLDVSFVSRVAAVGEPEVGWGTALFDYDNDGDKDIYVANGHTYPEADLPAHQRQLRPAQPAVRESRRRDLPRRVAAIGAGAGDPRGEQGRGVRRLRRRRGHRHLRPQPERQSPTCCATTGATPATTCWSGRSAAKATATEWEPGSRSKRLAPRPGKRGAQRRQLSRARRHARPLRPRQGRARRQGDAALAERDRADARGCRGEPGADRYRAGSNREDGICSFGRAVPGERQFRGQLAVRTTVRPLPTGDSCGARPSAARLHGIPDPNDAAPTVDAPGLRTPIAALVLRPVAPTLLVRSRRGCSRCTRPSRWNPIYREPYLVPA